MAKEYILLDIIRRVEWEGQDYVEIFFMEMLVSDRGQIYIQYNGCPSHLIILVRNWLHHWQ